LKDSIEANYKIKHSAGQYAEMLNIAPKSLSKISKTHFNKTITDLIGERIIMEAKRELYLSSKSVKVIASELGFDDPYYFSRYFKNFTEVSPEYYRANVGFVRSSNP